MVDITTLERSKGGKYRHCDFKVFNDVINSGGIINAIVIKNEASNYSRKDIDKLDDFVKIYARFHLKHLDQQVFHHFVFSISKTTSRIQMSF